MLHKRKCKLIINGIPLLSAMTGIGRFTMELSRYITLDINWNNTYFYYYGYYSRKLQTPSFDSACSQKSTMKKFVNVLKKIPFFKTLGRFSLEISSRLSAPNCFLYWEPNHIPLNGIHSKYSVLTVHDLSCMRFPNWHPTERVVYFKKFFEPGLKRANIIITGSNAIRTELLSFFPLDPGRVISIHHGINHDNFRIRSSENITEDLKDLELPNKFILAAGSLEPRKNLIRLLDAHALLPACLREEYPLLLVGFSGWNNVEIMSRIKQQNNVIYIGHVSDHVLASLYNRASIFVYPSLYEGFGLPPLEAMACGSPVIVSNTPVAKETCGQAANFCNPENAEDISYQIERLLKDDNAKKTLSVRGSERALSFTWEKASQEYIKVFNTF